MEEATCPHCGSNKRQTKAGRTRFGSQKFWCAVCVRAYTPQPKRQGHAPPLRQQALALLLEGMSQRKVARVLGVAPQRVANWLCAAQQRLEASEPQTLPPSAHLPCEVVELDELFTFVGHKRGEKNSSALS